MAVVQWVARSIPHGEPIEQVLIPVSAPQLVYKSNGMCYPVCRMVHIKEKVAHVMVAAGFLAHYLSSPLPCPTPYDHKLNVLSASLNKTSPSCFSGGSMPNVSQTHIHYHRYI